MSQSCALLLNKVLLLFLVQNEHLVKEATCIELIDDFWSRVNGLCKANLIGLSINYSVEQLHEGIAQYEHVLVSKCRDRQRFELCFTEVFRGIFFTHRALHPVLRRDVIIFVTDSENKIFLFEFIINFALELSIEESIFVFM